ncbi:MAG: hypothetical protein E7345_05330 [Clostridiales bacterium]|nr:hypothetical protein [Clostridiales bacterium]
MNYDKKITKLKLMSLTCLTATLLSLCTTGYLGYKHLEEMPTQFDDEELAEKLITMISSEDFNNHVSAKKDKLYQQLKRGDIDTSEFSEEFDKLNTIEYVIEWARTLEDEGVKEVIQNHDEEMTERKSDSDMYGNMAICGAISTVALGVATSKIIENKKRLEYDRTLD